MFESSISALSNIPESFKSSLSSALRIPKEVFLVKARPEF
jgi:hypothetical protein